MPEDYSEKTVTITLACDVLDATAIHAAIARYQKNHVDTEYGGTLLPEGQGNLGGRIIAEICRGWDEMLDMDFGKREGE
jgi:hypothetical protein